jgi:hypothetical protein
VIVHHSLEATKVQFFLLSLIIFYAISAEGVFEANSGIIIH